MTVTTVTETADGETTTEAHTLDFTYDASGNPQTITYDGVTYYYTVNIQGDVTGIVDENGNVLVRYTYQAYGTTTFYGVPTGSVGTTLRQINPITYRGYVYDKETKLYYLQSRYYNRTSGRFINADGLVATGQGLLGNNMFAYCLNNPVMQADPNGNRAKNTNNNDGYRFVGFGFQLELDVGAYEVGLEIVIYCDDQVCGGKEPIVAVYIYEGAFVDVDDFKKSTNYLKTVEKLTLAITTNAIDEQNAEALLIALQASLFNDVGVSGSVVAIFGNESFQTTESYSGPFDTYSVTVKHVKISLSTSSTCFTIAVGGSTEWLDISYGQSNYTQVY